MALFEKGWKTGHGKLDNAGAAKAVQRMLVVYHAGQADFNRR